MGALLETFLLDYTKSMQLLSFPKELSAKQRLKKSLLYILKDIEKGECAVVFKELWAIAERNIAVKKAVDQYYQDLHNMIFEVLTKAAAKDCQKQQIDKAAGILLPFIEGYCITHSNLRVSAEELSEQLATMLYQSLN